MLLGHSRHLPYLFVTGRDFDNGQDASTRKIRDVPAYDSHIGSHIGATSTNRFERVLNFQNGQLVVEAKFLDSRFKYFIDTSEPRFLREEAEFINSSTGQTNRYVYDNGKRP